MEEMRMKNGAISSYNLSPRYYDLPDPPMRTPLVAPLTPRLRRASFGTPYASDLLSVSCAFPLSSLLFFQRCPADSLDPDALAQPYERLAALEPPPYYTPKVTPYMNPIGVAQTPYGHRLGQSGTSLFLAI